MKNITTIKTTRRMKINFCAALMAAVSFFGFDASAQISTPAASPFSKVTQEIGLTNVTIEYSRPSARGRAIFGELLPFGATWRTGANSPTIITFDKAVSIGGKELAAGSYVITSVPGKTEWAVTFSQNEKEAASVKVVSVNYPVHVETFTLGIDKITDSSAELQILWEKTLVPIAITFNTDEQVMSQISQFAQNPEAALAGNYYQAATYYLATNRELEKALVWVDKAIAVNPDFFWQYRTKALILAGLGKYKEAIAVAQTSTEKAKVAGNADYPRMNDKSIAEWQAKK